MQKPMITLLGAAVCCTQIVSAEVKTTDNTSVDLYVQDGLIGHYDAIDNDGRGVHKTSATKWVNLAPADKEGRIDDIAIHTAAVQIRENALFKKGDGGKGLFGFITGKQPTNVVTFEGAVSGITNAISMHTTYTPRTILSLMVINEYQLACIAPNWLSVRPKDFPDVPDERRNDYAFVFDYGGAQTSVRYGPSFSERLDALTVAAIYKHQTGGSESCVYEKAYANGGELQRLTGFSGSCVSWSSVKNNNGNTTFGGTDNTSRQLNDNTTTNYSLHAIRFYDRTLSDKEVRWNAFVDHYRFEGAVSGMEAVSDGENAYTVTGALIPLDFAGDMTVKVAKVNAVDESEEIVQKFTIAPGAGGVRSFSFTECPTRCLLTVTASQTYAGKTLEKIVALKTWEDDVGVSGAISWRGKWTNPITSWYASENFWSTGRFPGKANTTINIGASANDNNAVRIGVPVALGPFAGNLFVALQPNQSNRLEVVNGASLELANTLVTSGQNDKIVLNKVTYGELILSNGTVKASKILAGYAPNKLHGGRIVVEGNSLLAASGNIWFGKTTINKVDMPDTTRSNVELLIRGGTVRCDTRANSTDNDGLFYGGPGMTIESGRIEAARIGFSDKFNIYGGVVESSVGLIFNNADDGVTLTQTGGTVRAPVSSDQQAGYYDMSGGKLVCPSLTTDLRGLGVKNRAIRFRTIGSAPKVSIADFGLGSKATDANKDWFVFWDYALGADGRVSAHENAATSVFGYYHVAPLGGVQLIHSNCVTLVHNAEKDLVEDTTRWSGHGIETIDGDMWTYAISADKRRMEATLKPDFKLTNGALLDTSVDRGYLDLSDQLAPGLKGLKSVTVKLALEPQTGTTLNDIIAKINESGAGTASAIDDGSGRWNVQVELPVTSVEKTADERVALDFTEYNTFKSTNTAMATPTPTVRAKIKGARVTVLRKGLVLFVL